jgi:O-antigen ligase/Tfp pilus assembly protein PilF
LVLLGLWIFSWILKGRVSITRTPLDMPLLFLLVAILISTFFSSTRFAAVYGNFPTVHGSAVAWITYILLYFVTVSNLRKVAQIKAFLYVMYASAVVVSAVTLLSFFHAYLPFDFAQAANFTPTGSSFSTIAFLLLLLPLPLLSLINPNKYMATPLAMFLTILFGVTVALTGSIPTYIVLAIVLALSIFVSKPQQLQKSAAVLAIPLIVVIATFALAYTPLPAPLNGIQQLEANFPKEIQLPFAVSWKVSASAFRDDPIKGTGPSSYLFNFTAYKPVEFNALRYWNFSFESAYNEFLQVLGTLGLLGTAALLAICIVAFKSAWKNLSAGATEVHEDTSGIMLPALAISVLTTVVLLLIHATTLVSIVATFFIIAAFMMSQKPIREKVVEFSLGLKATTSDNKQFDLFPVIVFVVLLILTVPVLVRTFNVVAADYFHRMALSQANKSGTLTYQYLQKAESLNPQVDLYRVDMAQTNFALANAIAIQKGPTKYNPKGTLTDQDKSTIQTLLSQAVNEGRSSVLLSPRSSRNWVVLASVYRNISGVANNALAFSLDAYGRAIQRDPLNPVLRLNVGGIYYAAKNYDQAIRFFSDAINLKPDYVVAYYNLAIALRDKGDLQNASQVAQQAITILGKDSKTSNDYKTATALLTDIKARIAKNASNANAQTAPAAETQSALGNGSVPGVNVDNLKNPPAQVVTPAPVKNNPNAKIPQPTTKPSVSPINR